MNLCFYKRVFALITSKHSFFFFQLPSTTCSKWLSCPCAGVSTWCYLRKKKNQPYCCFTLICLARSYVSLRIASEAMKSFREGVGGQLGIEISIWPGGELLTSGVRLMLNWELGSLLMSKVKNGF